MTEISYFNVIPAKIHVCYVKCEHSRSIEQLARYSKVTLELVRKIKRYRTLNIVADSFKILTIKVILSPSASTSFIFQIQRRRATPKQVNKGKRVFRLISYYDLTSLEWLCVFAFFLFVSITQQPT